MNREMKPVPKKSKLKIVSEWDQIAALRHQQIQSGKDLSYRFVILPCVLSLVRGSDMTSVIDVGCGTGALTSRLARTADRIVGVDLSAEHIRIAASAYSGLTNASFVTSSIEAYSKTAPPRSVTLAVANMTLMTILNLDSALRALARILAPGGHFVFTITHPFFWPLYWGYGRKKWFNYRSEIKIEAPFNISLEKTRGYVTTHVHRPLERYCASLSRVGFVIEALREPLPTGTIQVKYPEQWRYPRFLGAKCRLLF